MLTATLASTTMACAALPPGSQADALERTRAELRAVVDERDAPGIAYLVVDADGPRVQLQAGTVDASSRRPVTASTQFMIYSVTKVLTAIAVLQLVDEGRVELDAPIGRYVSGLPYGDDVTVRMLLAHTAGVPNPAPLDWFFVEGDAVDHDAALARVLQQNPKLASPPGSEYRYTNVGYWLLGALVEAVRGEEFGVSVQREIFGRLGVDAAAAALSLPPASRLATGHIRRLSLTNLVLRLLAPGRYFLDTRDGWTRLARVEGYGPAYGGGYATVGALGAVLSDLLREAPRLLGPGTRDRMFERQQAPAGTQLESTLGWAAGSLHGVPYHGKQGGGLGFQGNVRVYPTLGIATAYLANATAVTPGPIDAISDRLDGPLVQWLAASSAAAGANPAP